jgi:hypothetical protein
MPLNLNTWYRIAFPGRPDPSLIMVTVGEYEDIPPDHFVLELEASPDLSIEKVRMVSEFGASLSLCSNGMLCLQGAEDMADVEADMISLIVMTPEIPNSWEWITSPVPDMFELKLYCSLIPEGVPVLPCDEGQPELANPEDDPVQRIVGAYPMVFLFKGVPNGGGHPTGKKVKVIWKSEM